MRKGDAQQRQFGAMSYGPVNFDASTVRLSLIFASVFSEAAANISQLATNSQGFVIGETWPKHAESSVVLFRPSAYYLQCHKLAPRVFMSQRMETDVD